MQPELDQLRKRCPLPVLMHRLGLGRYAKSSVPSPFRPDQSPSWGIFERNGRWFFKDFGTDEGGDEITLLSQFLGLDQRRDFRKLLDEYRAVADRPAPLPSSNPPHPKPAHEKPDTSFLTTGTDEQLRKLSRLRTISLPGLEYARSRNVLKFGVWHGVEVFAVTDQSGLLVELRRLDNQWFEGYGGLGNYKSHTVKGSRKNWLLGVMEAKDCPVIALVEGMPDFLALHQFVVDEGLVGKVGPVAMLTSSCEIAAEALPYLTGKVIRIFPHLDLPGLNGAELWQKQLIKAQASRVEFFNLRALEIAAGVEVKDLCDFNQQRGLAGISPQQILNHILP